MTKLNNKYADVKTAADSVALRAENPEGVKCLRKIERESTDSGAKMKKMLALLLFATDKFLHLKEGMSSEEIFFTTESIIDEYGGVISFADIKIVLNNAKMGKYGKMYERLSTITVMDWFRQYIEERLNAAEQYNIKQSRLSYGTPHLRHRKERPEPSNDDKAYKDYRNRVVQDIIKREHNNE